MRDVLPVACLAGGFRVVGRRRFNPVAVLFIECREPEVMINGDRRGHSYCDVRGEILGSSQDGPKRKHLPRMFSLIKNETSGKPKFLNSGGSMVAKLKLKGIDGRAPPGVEPAA
ncbi:actin [Cucumis melo var. makuwa]|uniref:Actin n=1 Tax=Cucumis melo var. makuwa TaxID=1194695 RepID=A0A5D3E362_CUCMM|nr:actin [Cucumis melo var. makuwa]TYK30326.1 actin [Cucumis melo var. makuwa]